VTAAPNKPQGDVQLFQRRQSRVLEGDEFDLVKAMEAVRYGTAEYPPGFQVHPHSRKEDPVLVDLRGQKAKPPSQNPELLRYIGKTLL
jgi:hypothetical protein